MLISCGALSSCSNDATKMSDGYIDADLIYISSDFGGKLVELDASRGNFVKSGELLYQLEQTNEDNNIAASKENTANLQANLAATQNKLAYAKLNYKREAELKQQGFYSEDSLDSLKQNVQVLENEIVALKAQIKAASISTKQNVWQKYKKEVVASDNGIVFDTYYSRGEYIPPAAPVLSLVTESQIKAIFYIPETELSSIKLGQKVSLNLDNADEKLLGSINYISNISEYTPPIIYSQNMRQKLVYRIEAKIISPDLTKVHLGQPLSVELQ